MGTSASLLLLAVFLCNTFNALERVATATKPTFKKGGAKGRKKSTYK